MPNFAYGRLRRATVLAVVMTAGLAVATSTTSSGVAATTHHAASGARPAATQFAPLARRGPGPPPARLLDDVACTSSTYCMGVGARHYGTGHPQPLAEIFNGKGWHIVATPTPTTATLGQLNGVACVRSTCFAVGSYGVQSGKTWLLVERFTHGHWHLVPAPHVSVHGSGLDDVSCSTAHACMAVGETTAANGNPDQLILRLAHGAWHVADAAQVRGAESSLSNVSCSAGAHTRCVATGYRSTSAGQAPLVERYAGHGWRHSAIDSPGEQFSVTVGQVSCGGPDSCVLLGSYEKGINPNHLLVERWRSGQWHITRLTNLPSNRQNNLEAVSCRTAGHCVAVGASVGTCCSADYDRTILETYNHGRWRITQAKKPSDASLADISAVSCATTDTCVGVGVDLGQQGQQAYSEVFASSKSTIVPIA